MYRQEVRPFTDKQIELVTNFADQAVIAIENTRLLNELRQRTRDLTEVAGAADRHRRRCCKVISSSPGDLEPVFETMLENAVTHVRGKVRCYVSFATAKRFALPRCTAYIASLCASDAGVRLRHLDPEDPIGRIAADQKLVHIARSAADQSYIERDPRMVEAVELAGARTFVASRC